MKLGNLAPETVLTAMQCLAQDPNFEVLKQVIQMNDIDKMRLDLEDDKISVEDTQKLRYRLKVFKEMMEMPQKLALLLIDSIKGEVERKADEVPTYHDPDSIEEGK